MRTRTARLEIMVCTTGENMIHSHAAEEELGIFVPQNLYLADEVGLKNTMRTTTQNTNGPLTAKLAANGSFVCFLVKGA